MICAGVIALIFAVVAQSSGAAEHPLPLDPNNAGPDTVLAETLGVEVSTPVRPADLTGLGYHPEGESLLELDPRGENLSANPLLGLLGTGDTPEDLRYYVMDRAESEGPRTGALDVGAEAGTEVYAPVSGVVTAIQTDPTMQDANIVEIKPAGRTDVRVYVSLVRDMSGDVGPGSPVTAGMTMLGTVADSAAVLDPQLSSYTEGSGNHVTVYALQVG
ncbi:MAG: M23 family metallopeptidase [Actinomycetota bacterium]|nr:M23 family metallopeptidase [Actinomycetota bacterium]